jgi:hypothetical protein
LVGELFGLAILFLVAVVVVGYVLEHAIMTSPTGRIMDKSLAGFDRWLFRKLRNILRAIRNWISDLI